MQHAPGNVPAVCDCVRVREQIQLRQTSHCHKPWLPALLPGHSVGVEVECVCVCEREIASNRTPCGQVLVKNTQVLLISLEKMLLFWFLFVFLPSCIPLCLFSRLRIFFNSASYNLSLLLYVYTHRTNKRRWEEEFMIIDVRWSGSYSLISPLR